MNHTHRRTLAPWAALAAAAALLALTLILLAGHAQASSPPTAGSWTMGQPGSLSIRSWGQIAPPSRPALQPGEPSAGRPDHQPIDPGARLPPHLAARDGAVGAALLFVNYTFDWVAVNGTPNATVVITIYEPGGFSTTMAGQADANGHFRSWWVPWPDKPPDIAPGVVVEAWAGGDRRAINPVGIINGETDYEADTVSGYFDAPWFGPGTLDGGCWSTSAGEAIALQNIPADGGSFECDFGAGGIDLRPGVWVSVWYDEPDGDEVIVDVMPLEPYVTVDYTHDWVSGNYEPDHTVWLTLTQSDQTTVKATARLETKRMSEWGGGSGFETQSEDWQPLPAEIEIDDWLYVRVDNGHQNAVQVGKIDGLLDVDADTVAGQVYAPWIAPGKVNVSCEVHEEGGPAVQVQEVDPDGGAFFCDLGAVGWDVQPGHNIAVNYNEPDTDRVQTHFIEPAPNLHLEKWVEGHNQVAPGGRLVFGLRYRNDGDAVAQTVILTDTLPAKTAHVADSSGVTPAVAGQTLLWTLGPLSPGEEGVFHLVVSNSASPSTTLTNLAGIDALHNRDEDDNLAKAEAHVEAGQPDLSVGKDIEPGDPAPGQTFVYHINVGNQGPVTSGPATLTDRLPDGVTVESWWSNNGYGLWNETQRNGTLVLTAPAIPAQWGDTLHVRVRLDAGVEPGTELTNEVEIATANDSDPSNDSSQRTDWAGNPRYDLGIYKSFGWGQLVAGGQVGYNIHFRNQGNVAVPVVVSDTLPAGASFVESGRWTGWTEIPFPPTSLEDGVAVWQVASLQPGEWVDLVLRTAIDADVTAGTTLTNCATIAIAAEDIWPFNNESCSAEDVNGAGPNLRIHKDVRWEWEGQLHYELIVENVGTTGLKDIWLSDTYPADTAWNGDWWPMWGPWITATHVPADRELDFWIEGLHPGETAGIGFRVDLDGSIVGEQGRTFTNHAAAPVTGDIDPGNNTADVTAYTGPDLHARKWLSEGTPRAGERITMTVLFGNQNRWPWQMAEDTTVRLTERLPTGMTYVRAVWPDGNRFEPDIGGPDLPVAVWDTDRLGPEDQRWFYLAVDLGEDLKPADVLQNRLEIVERPPVDIDPVPGNNTFIYPVRLAGERIYLPVILRD